MLSLRNLLRRKVRTALTVSGVAVGVCIVVALTSVARGFRTQLNGMFSAGKAHLILSRKDAADPILSYLPDAHTAAVEAMPEVSRAYPIVLAARQTTAIAAFVFYGTTPASPFLEQFRISEGSGLFAEGAPEHRILLGRRAAKNLERAVGESVRIGKHQYEVVGIFESAVPLIEAGAVLPYADAQSAAGLEGKATSVLIEIHDVTPEGIAAAELAIERAFPDIEATSPTEWTNAFREFELADQTVTVFTLLAVAIGGISVMNTMLMSVFERTREIGVLQAIGWSRSMVLREVLAEALLVSIAGGPLGIALGVGVVELIGTFREFAWIAGHYDASVFATAMAVAIGMGVVGASYPAWRAVSILPVEALRYE
jgi:ABC-type lipoprotein release transport system permease subunit